jgi:hypothetical protein
VTVSAAITGLSMADWVTAGLPITRLNLSEILDSLATFSVAGFLAAGSTAARLVVMGVMAVKAEIVVGVEGTRRIAEAFAGAFAGPFAGTGSTAELLVMGSATTGLTATGLTGLTAADGAITGILAIGFDLSENLVFLATFSVAVFSVADWLTTFGIVMTGLAASGLVGVEGSIGTAGIEGAEVIVGCLTAASPVVAEGSVGVGWATGTTGTVVA